MSELASRMPLKPPPCLRSTAFFGPPSSNADIRAKTLSTSEDEGIRCGDDNFSISKRGGGELVTS